jgi:hypothetical protein
MLIDHGEATEATRQKPATASTTVSCRKRTPVKADNYVLPPRSHLIGRTC